MFSGFHVHEYPTTTGKLGGMCGPKSVGGHFNPFNKSANPPANDVTYDMFEVGDMSGKYKHPLDDKSSVSFQKMDSNLPLRGVNSIVGRSVVIHKKMDGSRFVCGNIEEDTTIMNSKMLKATATFKGDIEGMINMVIFVYEKETHFIFKVYTQKENYVK